MSEADIGKLFAAKVNKLQHPSNTVCQRPLQKAAINFDYQKMKEKCALEKPSAGRMLACLVLAKSHEACFLPFDPFEAKQFFNDFKCKEEEALEEYCRMKNENKDELLAYYRNIAESNRNRTYNTPRKTETNNTLNLLAATFARLTR